MSNKPDGGAAFPDADGAIGMTLRDYFAAKAMAALIQSGSERYQYTCVAQEAYEYADAMIAWREQ